MVSGNKSRRAKNTPKLPTFCGSSDENASAYLDALNAVLRYWFPDNPVAQKANRPLVFLVGLQGDARSWLETKVPVETCQNWALLEQMFRTAYPEGRVDDFRTELVFFRKGADETEGAFRTRINQRLAPDGDFLQCHVQHTVQDGAHWPGVASTPATARAPTSIAMPSPAALVVAQSRMETLHKKLVSLYSIDRGTSGRPVHVFVDLSNILVPLHQSTGRWLDFAALAKVLERERPVARRVVCGSKAPSAMELPPQMVTAEGLGYKLLVLDRRMVYTTGPASARLENSTTGNGILGRNREIGVDELLQLKMCNSILDTSSASGWPGVIVLATGDGAVSTFSEGFVDYVERAVNHGWLVEIITWRSTMSQRWPALSKKHPGRVMIVFLDNYHSELVL